MIGNLFIYVLSLYFVLSVFPGEVWSIKNNDVHGTSTIKIKKVPIVYEIYGKGKPIIVLHGFMLDKETMKGCMEPIFKKRNGWKRIYLDLPGMGSTKSADWIQNSDDILDVLILFIEKILREDTFVLIGESYGGYLARGITYKNHKNVIGMLLICPLVEPDFTKRKLLPPVILKRDTQLFNSLSSFEQKTFQRFMVVQNRQNWERFKKEMVSSAQKGDQAFLQKIRKLKNYSLSFPIDSLKIPYTKPVLILTGRQDALVGYKDAWNILDNYPRATFAVLDMAGHALQIEQEKLFAALVQEFLDRVADIK